MNELERLVQNEQLSRSNKKRIDELEKLSKGIYELNSNIRELIVDMRHMNRTVQEHEQRILSIEGKPGYILTAATTAVVTGTVGIILAGLIN